VCAAQTGHYFHSLLLTQNNIITVCCSNRATLSQFVAHTGQHYHSLLLKQGNIITVCCSNRTTLSQFVAQTGQHYHSLLLKQDNIITVSERCFVAEPENQLHHETLSVF
jgi:UDP-N-acetylglucosamine 2-epimerase